MKRRTARRRRPHPARWLFTGVAGCIRSPPRAWITRLPPRRVQAQRTPMQLALKPEVITLLDKGLKVGAPRPVCNSSGRGVK
jgi:hypothetical protein